MFVRFDTGKDLREKKDLLTPRKDVRDHRDSSVDAGERPEI